MENINSNIVKRENKKLKLVFIIFIICLILSAAVILLFRLKKSTNKITIKQIQAEWSLYDYQSVYDHSKAFLELKPYNNTALTYYGYSAFYLAVSQNDTYNAQNYLEEAINNLRIALYDANKSLKPQLEYMLGKAYFYKNTITNYYYADLSIKYLEAAREHGYQADDISEYLGLSYAALGQTMESISAFTEALLVRESDSLLMSIAEQYYKTKEYNASKQYLYRVMKNSENDEIIITCKNMLGNIYFDEENYDEANREFNEVLEINENSPDAHFGIGLLYEKQGNLVKARSEWRKVLKLQPNHPGAIKKMS